MHLSVDEGNTQRLNYGRMRNPPPWRLLPTSRRISTLQDGVALLPRAQHLGTPHLSTPQSHFFFPCLTLLSSFSFALCALRIPLTTSQRVGAVVCGNVTRAQTDGRTGHTCPHLTPASRTDQSLRTHPPSAPPVLQPSGEPRLNCGFGLTLTRTFGLFTALACAKQLQLACRAGLKPIARCTTARQQLRLASAASYSCFFFLVSTSETGPRRSTSAQHPGVAADVVVSSAYARVVVVKAPLDANH